MTLRLIEPDWRLPHIRALSTERHFHPDGASVAPFASCNLGAHCGDSAQAVQRNRLLLADALGLPAAPRWLRQVHGNSVWRFDGSTGAGDGSNATAAAGAQPADDEPPQADAAVTSSPGEVLAILSADCLPVLFAAVDGSEVAAAHAGWRGLAGGVLEATIGAMDIAPDRLLAWMAPAAGPFAYEVGDEVREAFVDGDPGASVAFGISRPHHWWCDLYQLARRRLLAAGVRRVSGGGHCTINEPDRFFSHRRDGRSGRMASLIWIGATAARNADA